MFLGGHKNGKILYIYIYRAPYSYHGEYTALTMVNTQRTLVLDGPKIQFGFWGMYMAPRGRPCSLTKRSTKGSTKGYIYGYI